MVYLYLCNYAHKQPGNFINTFWIVIINLLYLRYGNNVHKYSKKRLVSLLKHEIFFCPDNYCSDNEDPMIRGFALRSLCNLRLETILEYVDQPIRKSLVDLSPYVRKTGVMGILKVYCVVLNWCILK